MPAPTPEVDTRADAPTTPPGRLRRVVILGSTGSIGTQTLDVIAALNARAGTRANTPLSTPRMSPKGESSGWSVQTAPDGSTALPHFKIVGLAAGSNNAALARQAAAIPGVRCAVARPDADTPHDAITGPDAPERLVRDLAPDLVVSAIVGAAGLPATLAAAQLGADVALANKESLVAAGPLVVEAARRSGARLLPVDSEHAAIWQALARPHAPDQRIALCPPCDAPDDVARVTLTASGGAFRDTPLADLASVTRAMALAHPTWSMGDKITIDCATMVNKAFELIEARWLFGLDPDRLGVLVHRQSIVHSLVTYRDGNTLAQLGPNDMRVAIQHALTFPHRAPSPVPPLDLAASATLTFEEPDPARYPALALGWRVMHAGGTAGAIFNAANEEAVNAFLRGAIPFTRIADVCRRALDELPATPLTTLDDALEADAAARALARRACGVGA